MENQPPANPNDGLTTAVKRLTIALWCLCALLAVWLGMSLWSLVSPTTFVGSSDYGSTRITSGEVFPGGDLANFHDFKIDEKIKRSSVVLVVENRRQGNRIAAVVSEILKKDPGTNLHYEVGDVYESLSHVQHADEVYGDGQVAFLLGDPAQMVSSYSYSKGRIGGLGDMKLEAFRELVTRLSSESPK
jgi:hypothetical protein